MSPLALIAGAAGLVWALVLAVRAQLFWGVLAFLVVLSCFGTYFLQFDVGSITLSLDRLLLVGLCAAWVWHWHLGRIVWKPLGPLDYLLLGFLGVLLTSMLTHDWRNYTKGDVPIVQHLLNGYAIPVAVYFLVRQLTLDESDGQLLLTGLTCFGVYLACTGICEALHLWSFVFPAYIANPAVGLHFGRARGPMIHAVSYGVYLGACLLAAWLARQTASAWWRLLLWATVPLFLAAIYFTKTRSVWFGAATGLVLLIAFSLHHRWRWWVLGGAVATGLLLGVAKLDALLSIQREGTVQDTVQSAGMRASFTYVSWRMFLDRPLFGFGFGQFAKAKYPYLGDHSVALPLEQIRAYVHHNTFLSLLTETGLVGMSMYVALLLGWGYCGWRLVDTPETPAWMQRCGLLMIGMLGLLFWQQVGHEITFTPHDHALLFLLGGITVNLAAASAAAADDARSSAGHNQNARRAHAPAADGAGPSAAPAAPRAGGSCDQDHPLTTAHDRT